jgi:hypothetical protein
MIYRRFDRVCFTHIGTGGQQSRDIARCLNMSADLFDMGGPLDAPSYIPAGSVNSTDAVCGPWHLNNGKGQPCPSQTVVER